MHDWMKSIYIIRLRNVPKNLIDPKWNVTFNDTLAG